MTGRDQIYLEDMLSFAKDAVELLGDCDARILEADKKTQYAVIRAIEVVGEAASKVSSVTQLAYPDLPWRQAVGMRNVLIHGYRGLDLDLIVQTVRSHFPSLIVELTTILGVDRSGS